MVHTRTQESAVVGLRRDRQDDHASRRPLGAEVLADALGVAAFEGLAALGEEAGLFLHGVGILAERLAQRGVLGQVAEELGGCDRYRMLLSHDFGGEPHGPPRLGTLDAGWVEASLRLFVVSKSSLFAGSWRFLVDRSQVEQIGAIGQRFREEAPFREGLPEATATTTS